VLPPTPIILAGHGVRLEPLAEGHRDALRAAVDADRAAFTVAGPGVQPGGLDAWTDDALHEAAAGTRIPFAVLADGAFAGSTSYLDLATADARIEIGHTWYAGAFQGTIVNPACKLLLLGHAFDTLGAERVSLKCDARNARSRRAILGIGATFEGVLRSYGRRAEEPSRLRDAAMFSILVAEWPAVRERLSARVARAA
jgi:N-acetyltransferase